MPRCRWSLPAVLALLASVALAPVPATAAPPDNCDRCFAMVRSDATIIKHRGLAANFRIRDGVTRLNFKYPLSRCAVTATIDSHTISGDTDAQLGWLSIRRASTTDVFVTIVGPGDGSSLRGISYPFNLTVTC